MVQSGGVVVQKSNHSKFGIYCRQRGIEKNNRQKSLSNYFIKNNHSYIRGIEDKQVGKYFIKDELISKSAIQSKLMFFIWDSVFTRDKKPLLELLDIQDKNQLITFGDFATKIDNFIERVESYNV